VEEGFYAFRNFMDLRSWYPIGRNVVGYLPLRMRRARDDVWRAVCVRTQGGTLYPGLMLTAALAYHILHALHFTVSIRLVCVFLAPVFAGITAMCVFALGREVTLGPRGDERFSTPAATAALYRKANAVGLISAAFAAIVPGYISRSVAGSYDNEGVAIFALIITFYLWSLALNTGSVVAATATALAYFYMVGAWGGYVFIINILPIHALVLLVSGRYSVRLYTAFSVFYVVGTLLSMQVSRRGTCTVAEGLEAQGACARLPRDWRRRGHVHGCRGIGGAGGMCTVAEGLEAWLHVIALPCPCELQVLHSARRSRSWVSSQCTRPSTW